MNPKSIYIHIPFCKNICKYCDFCKMFYNEKMVNDYIDELIKEININYNNQIIDTIYIGGGTPSSLSLENLKKIFDKLNDIKLNNNYEFTFECNIEDINNELLLFLKNNRVNRISIGVESFNKKILKTLGRNIDVDIINKINLVKKYFNNINIDLIYGINGEDIDDLNNDLDNFLNLNVKHISIYCLILEDNTILKCNNYEELDSDIQRQMYDLICDKLKNNGYIHYEISNFSKKGYESKHNLCYWNNEEYYGFGLGASGYVNDIRYTNTKSINKYLNHDYIKDSYKVSLNEKMENEMILGLRKLNGVSKENFYRKYSKNINDVFNVSKLGENDKYYYIKEEDIFISNSILCDFIDV